MSVDTIVVQVRILYGVIVHSVGIQRSNLEHIPSSLLPHLSSLGEKGTQARLQASAYSDAPF